MPLDKLGAQSTLHDVEAFQNAARLQQEKFVEVDPSHEGGIGTFNTTGPPAERSSG